MPWAISCSVCGHLIIADKKNAFLQAIVHFKSSHEKNFNGLVFDNSHEFIDEEYHKSRREVIFRVIRISKDEYEFYKTMASQSRKSFRKLHTEMLLRGKREIESKLGLEGVVKAPSSVSIF